MEQKQRAEMSLLKLIGNQPFPCDDDIYTIGMISGTYSDSKILELAGIFNYGKIQGIRAERARRTNCNIKQDTINMSLVMKNLIKDQESEIISKDFLAFVYRRCERALLDNDKYMSMERDKNIEQGKVQAKAEELCYKQGFSDAMEFILNSRKWD